MQRPLRHDELSRRVVARHIISVDVIGALVVIDRLQLKARVVVGKNVGETILGAVTWQVSKRARLVAPNVLQLLEFFAKSVNTKKRFRKSPPRKPSPSFWVTEKVFQLKFNAPKVGICRHQAIMFGEVFN